MRQLTYNPVRKPSHDNTSEAEAYGVDHLRCGSHIVAGAMACCSIKVRCSSATRSRRCCASAWLNFLIGVIVPVAGLAAQGESAGFSTGGTVAATVAGALGAAGAVCIIWAFRFGGLPIYVMPLVFGGAPMVNVLVSMAIHPPKQAINPLLFVGFGLASVGAALVLDHRPAA